MNNPGYSFFEGGDNSGHFISLSIDRDTVSKIQITTLNSNQQAVKTEILNQGEKYTAPGFTVINGDSSVFVLTGSLNIVYDVYSYLSGENGGWGGYAVLKPLSQTQTTEYVDAATNKSIADSVTMTGLSGQKYTTKASDQLTGFDAPEVTNGNGYMSPFTAVGQTFSEDIWSNKGGIITKTGTLTYTVNDLKTGEMLVSMDGSAPVKIAKGGATFFGNYKAKSIFIDQTTTITYR